MRAYFWWMITISSRQPAGRFWRGLAGKSDSQHGQEALERLSDPEVSAPIGLVITDHLMPVMSGPEFVSELRRRGYTLPVVVLSGLPDAEAAYQGLNVIFRVKPFDPDSLIRLVQDLLGECMRRSA